MIFSTKSLLSLTEMYMMKSLHSFLLRNVILTLTIPATHSHVNIWCVLSSLCYFQLNVFRLNSIWFYLYSIKSQKQLPQGIYDELKPLKTAFILQFSHLFSLWWGKKIINYMNLNKKCLKSVKCIFILKTEALKSLAQGIINFHLLKSEKQRIT